MFSYVSFDEGDKLLTWSGLMLAFEDGHKQPKALIKDSFMYRKQDTLLSRSAWIENLGICVKSATVFPNNHEMHDLPSVNGSLNLFSDSTGCLEAIIDFHLCTKWKTAGDSVWAAKRLARPDSKSILVVGAGTVCKALLQAYHEVFPAASFKIWNRTRSKAEALKVELERNSVGVVIEVVSDLASCVSAADIITCATSCSGTDPILKGEWLRPGQHVDLIGAFTSTMREADDEAIRRSSVFVDSFETTVEHIGEIALPIQNGTLARSDIRADYYDDLNFTRRTDDEITLFKNGGGAHLDLMTASFILKQYKASQM